jgi:hypothetical protein
MWTVWIPGTEDYVPIRQFGDRIVAANHYFFGTPSRPSDDCGTLSDSGAPFIAFCFFILFNVTYNMLMLYTFKAGSSVLFVVASAARLPLVDILLMFRLLAGPAQATFTVYDGFTLVALVLAITTYNLSPEIKPHVLIVPTPQVDSGRGSSDNHQLLNSDDSDEGASSSAGHPSETPGGMPLAPIVRHSDYGSISKRNGGASRDRVRSV